MPWWVTFYFLAFGGITAAWLKSELRDKAGRPYLLIELASEICLVVVALGYWLASIRTFVGSASLVVFVAGCAWLLVAAARELGSYGPDPEMSRALNAAALASGVGVYLLLSAPLLYWGYSYAVGGVVAGP